MGNRKDMCGGSLVTGCSTTTMNQGVDNMGNRVNNENAELIGRPIIEGIIEAHSNSDYDKLVELVSGMKDNFSQEEFNGAASAVKALGRILSIEYLAYFSKAKEDLLLWRVKYELGEDDVFWHLYLSANENEIRAVGLLFDL